MQEMHEKKFAKYVKYLKSQYNSKSPKVEKRHEILVNIYLHSHSQVL